MGLARKSGPKGARWPADRAWTRMTVWGNNSSHLRRDHRQRRADPDRLLGPEGQRLHHSAGREPDDPGARQRRRHRGQRRRGAGRVRRRQRNGRGRRRGRICAVGRVHHRHGCFVRRRRIRRIRRAGVSYGGHGRFAGGLRLGQQRRAQRPVHIFTSRPGGQTSHRCRAAESASLSASLSGPLLQAAGSTSSSREERPTAPC